MSGPGHAVSTWARAICLVVLVARAAAAADKVDVVTLKNGDRITCEIKRLDRSVLSIGTDPLGSVSVHWGDIATLSSPRRFDLQLTTGEHHLGVLVAAAPGEVRVTIDGATTISLSLATIVRLAPIGASFWNRVDVALDAGFSFAQADLETHWTLNGTASYRRPRARFNASVASQVTVREDEDTLSRNSVGLNAIRSFGNRWYTITWAQLQQNQELSLDLRVVAGAGVGRDLVHTSHRLWSGFLGLAYSHEQFVDEPVGHSAEAAIGGQVDFFTPGHEDFRITNTVVSYVSLTDRMRFRLELQSAWRHEFLKDFYWSVNGFDSFDGAPPADQKTNDFGVSITIGWKF